MEMKAIGGIKSFNKGSACSTSVSSEFRSTTKGVLYQNRSSLTPVHEAACLRC
jgi:hypothetical protein